MGEVYETVGDVSIEATMSPNRTVRPCSRPAGLEPGKSARDKEQPHVPERLFVHHSK